MEILNWKLTFQPILLSLRAVGLWPESKTYKIDFYTIYAAICVPLFMFANTLFQVMNIFMIELDLEALASALFVAAHVMATIKVIVFLKNMKIIKKLTSQLNSLHFQPKDKTQVKIVEVDLKLWMMLYRGFQGGVSGMVIFWLTQPFLNGSYRDYHLPVFAWYPFNVKNSPNYEIAYIYQIVGMSCIGVANLNLDALSVTLMVYIGAQCDILRDNLKQIRNINDLTRCIKHHKKILQFTSDFNIFFSSIILGQFFTSVASIALGLFKLILTTPGSNEFYSLVAFSYMATFQIFLYCWYGNEVELRSMQIPTGAFESEWVGTSLKIQKTLLIFLIRTRKQISITAFNLFPLSLETFMKILRTSWSYFAVLRQLNSP